MDAERADQSCPRLAADMIQEPSPQEPGADEQAPPPIDAEIEAAARISGIAFDEDERALMEPSVRRAWQRYERRRAHGLAPNELAPATVFDPWLGRANPDGPYRVAPTEPPTEPGPVPESDLEIAYAPAWRQAAWLRGGGLTSVRLTEIALARIAKLDSKLHACITVTSELARAQAQQADRDFALGLDRGPLQGLPWGAKDLFDTAGISTTYGAAAYRDRVPSADAAVVSRLHEAGAVLVAKTTLGALAMGDVWFGGRTRNPWNPEQGSSGSSAGSSAGVGAGLFSFALGTETYGSIVSPSVRCGVTGLRPTFGRVPRSGAMALCWSLDKVGAITRSVRDTRLVLDAIQGPDADDPSCRAMRLDEDLTEGELPLSGLRIGVRAQWFEGRRPQTAALAALDTLIALGATKVEIELPEGPHDLMLSILQVEAAAAFEELTRSGRDDLLTRQDAGAWPNNFRSSWMVPAVELLQADRYRRQLAADFEQVLEDAQVDALFSPPFAGDLLLVTNFTGHPCLTLRSTATPRPSSVTLWGRLAGEATLFRIGEALEAALDVASARPPIDD